MDDLQTSTAQRQTGRFTWLITAVALIVLVALSAGAVYVWQQQLVSSRDTRIHSLETALQQAKGESEQAKQSGTYTSSKGIRVTIYAPTSNQKVASPVAVVGQVPGSWSFEASFPVELLDSTNKVVATGTAHVLGDWMTSQLTPFSASLTYSVSPTGNGTLVLHKDNPSGLPQNDDEVRIPIRF